MNQRRSLTQAPETIAGIDPDKLSYDELIAMKNELQAQLSTRRAEIESRRAVSRNNLLDPEEWHTYLDWRGRVAGLISVIEKEISLRKSKAKEDGVHSLHSNRLQVAQLASFIMADRILDDMAMGRMLDGGEMKAAAADSVQIAKLCVNEVWSAMDAETKK